MANVGKEILQLLANKALVVDGRGSTKIIGSDQTIHPLELKDFADFVVGSTNKVVQHETRGLRSDIWKIYDKRDGVPGVIRAIRGENPNFGIVKKP